MLELTMAAVTAADAGATAGMQMAEAPSEPGAVLRVGRDKSVCRLSTPDDWLFVSRVHLEFRCGPEGTWHLTWLRGSQPDPSSEVRLTVGGHARSVAYGGSVPLPRGGSGEIVVQDRSEPRSVNVGFYHEV
ncbi:FHA domain-containing protein [Streptomyces sp. A144]|uniref:FHA domain-containing protein n=1 Tax=Streptomyces TaxID=1883 RepID=UPI001CBEA85F|nr:FHA domain-containing protein [Streptomyces sp. A144]UAX53624.1 FHA domain-containing protein [Streptomyces sp. A144]